MDTQERDLLIRLDTKADQINSTVTEMKSTQMAQWKIIDEHSKLLAMHDENIKSMSKLLWWLIAIIFGTGGSIGLIRLMGKV